MRKRTEFRQTAANALKQIEEKNYEADLIAQVSDGDKSINVTVQR